MSSENAESNLKLFSKYSYTDVVVSDNSLSAYINLDAKSSFPHTASRLNKQQFGKGKILVVERFVCNLMRKGRNNGKKRLAMSALSSAFDIISTLTKQNPMQILCDAIINAGPREDSARVGKGGAMKRTSVDVSPLRRLNIALFLLTKGIRQSALKSTTSFPECIANELMAAAKNSPNSFAVKKKDDIERMAKSNR